MDRDWRVYRIRNVALDWYVVCWLAFCGLLDFGLACCLLALWLVGALDCYIVGLLDCWLFAFLRYASLSIDAPFVDLVCWFIGLRVNGSVSVACWLAGLLVCGLLGCWLGLPVVC